MLLGLAAKSLLKDEPRGLCGALEGVLGRRAGRIASLTLGLWTAFYGGFLIRSGAERYISTVYKDEQLWVFVFTIGGVALAAALGRVRSAARMGQVCAAIIGGVLVLLLLLGMPDVKKHYLLPVNPLDAGYIAVSALPVLNTATGWVFLCFLSGYIVPGSCRKRTLVKWAAYIVMLAEAVTVGTVGVLGPETAESLRYPFFALISDLRVFNIFERIEPVTVMIWVLTDMVFIALLMMSAGEVGRSAVGSRSRRWPVVTAALLMMAVAFVIGGDAFSLVTLSERLIPGINLLIAVILLPVLALIKKVKKVEKRC